MDINQLIQLLQQSGNMQGLQSYQAPDMGMLPYQQPNPYRAPDMGIVTPETQRPYQAQPIGIVTPNQQSNNLQPLVRSKQPWELNRNIPPPVNRYGINKIDQNRWGAIGPQWWKNRTQQTARPPVAAAPAARQPVAKPPVARTQPPQNLYTNGLEQQRNTMLNANRGVTSQGAFKNTMTPEQILAAKNRRGL